jgi:anti-anti-sigma regulatory factor
MARADGAEEEDSVTEEVRCVISVGGAFDASTGSALCTRLAAMRSGTSVVLDFRHARDVNDVALAMLLRRIGELRARVWLWGLSQHHERVLRYLGLASGRGPSRETVP